jgi:glycine cleavage system regulatory protein
MEKVKTKHFQYTGLDDYNRTIDEQINAFFEAEKIGVERLISTTYFAHSTEGINYYTALIVYRV